MYKKYEKAGLLATRFVGKILLSKLVEDKKIQPDFVFFWPPFGQKKCNLEIATC